MKKGIILLIGLGLLVIGLNKYHDQMLIAEEEQISRPIVSVTLSNEMQFKLMLYPDMAPNTVSQMITLINSGFYEETFVNEIDQDFLICLGDPIGDGSGYPGYYIQSECTENGVPNTLSCTEGTVCMARGENYNTEGSQFFVLLKDATYLDGTYTTFAKVIKGMDELRKIEENEQITIKKIAVQTFGRNYEMPQVCEIE